MRSSSVPAASASGGRAGPDRSVLTAAAPAAAIPAPIARALRIPARAELFPPARRRRAAERTDLTFALATATFFRRTGAFFVALRRVRVAAMAAVYRAVYAPGGKVSAVRAPGAAPLGE